jgi:HEAT repeat protein
VGKKLYDVTVSKETEVFAFHVDSEPRMVLFDKGGQVLKSAEFHKEKKEWIYQLKNATEVADRADAVVALGKLKNDEEAIAALGDALRNDKGWWIRANAGSALGDIGGAAAKKSLLEALDSAKEPWLRERIVGALGNIKDDAVVATKLEAIAKDDASYRTRAAALQGLGRLKAANALATLEAAVKGDSPDGFLRNAALRAFGPLGDDKAVPLLLEWSKPGKEIDARNAAIASLGRLQKDNKGVTAQIAGYLSEPRFPVRMASVFALGGRGDASAIPALETLLKSDDLSIEMVPMIKGQIARLKNPPGGQRGGGNAGGEEAGGGDAAVGATNDQGAVAKRLDRLEHLVQEMNERLKTIETRLPAPKP